MVLQASLWLKNQLIQVLQTKRPFQKQLRRQPHLFLTQPRQLVKGEVEIIHSDNGSEFAGEFELACKSLSVAQVYSRPHTPKDNPSLERFNWTIQDEWLALSEVGLDDVDDANKDLTAWLIEYNNFRPHETLAY